MLQRRLGIGQTKLFDKYTELAVLVFQKRLDIPMTGVVDENMWRILEIEHRKAGHDD